jgi:hypothetical protein
MLSQRDMGAVAERFKHVTTIDSTVCGDRERQAYSAVYPELVTLLEFVGADPTGQRQGT